MLVFVVGGVSFFGQFIHPFGADLHLDPTVFRPHHRNVQGFVPGGFWGRYPIAQAARIGVEFIRDDGIYFPRAEFFLLFVAFVDDPDGETVVYLVETHPFVDHLFVDGIDGFVAPRDGVVQVFFVQDILDHPDEPLDVFLLCLVGFLEQTDDIFVGLRFGVFEREILHFGLDIVQPQSVCQRSVDVERFGGDLLLFLPDHGTHRLHIVQAVGQFDQDHADVVGDGDEHLAEILRLYAHVGIGNTRYFGQPVDDPGYGGPVFPLDLLEGHVGVLHGVVQ